MIMVGKKIISIAMLLFFVNVASAQITAGKIGYERKTNLHKKFKGDTV